MEGGKTLIIPYIIDPQAPFVLFVPCALEVGLDPADPAASVTRLQGGASRDFCGYNVFFFVGGNSAEKDVIKKQ